MPTLTWVGKDKVVNHHHEVPFKVLQQQSRFDVPDDSPANSTDNRIIHGDNLEALKSLLPEFEGKVNCIYIDPPYNTGNEGWLYNDAVNDPKIRKWLGQVVGKEGEDLSRHDKWLCMMYPRLKLLHRLLTKDGVIFISIDDNEQATLKLLMDEIFGGQNFVTNVIWQKKYAAKSDSRLFSQSHDFLLVVAKNIDRFTMNHLPKTDKQHDRYTNRDNDSRGSWKAGDVLRNEYREYAYFAVTLPSGREVFPPSGTSWRFTKEKFAKLIADNRIWFGQDGDKRPALKRFLSEVKETIPPTTIWGFDEVGHNDAAKKEIRAVYGEDVFSTPKPSTLIERVLQIATNKNSLILDSFAGSGTTAHAVLKLNAQDGGNRRFILIEMEDYADTITAERVRRVISGYGEGVKQVDGLGGSFDYYTVGEPIFNPDDTLNESVGVEVIRDYVAYSEGVPTENRTLQANDYTHYLLGLNSDTAWLFYYEPNQVTCLDLDFLDSLKFGAAKPETAIIYADKCLLTKEFMTKYGVIFKKIPRDITRF
jgi:adenine-specific DNA-methyltransferase